MALSEEEQRLLAQMEAALEKDDPHLASVLRGTPHVVVHRRAAALGGLALAVGLGLLVAGMATFWLVSVLGFLVMLFGTVVFVRAYTMEADEDAPATTAQRPQARATASVPRGDAKRDFMAAMEEQWRRRQQEQREG